MKSFTQRGVRGLRRLLGIDGIQNRLARIEAEQCQSQPDSLAAKTSQLLLAGHYRSLANEGGPLPNFGDVEFRAFSQNGEDGILLYLFALLGSGKRRVLEICAGDGRECNAANLIINHGWNGLLIDGNRENVERGQRFYRSHPDTHSFPPRLVQAWVTRENVNHLVEQNDFAGDLDLLSLDMDGVDYWIWDALEVVRPRVVIAEVQCIWGTEASVTVPYDPQFRARYVDGFGVYSGASLPAFIKLAEKKGYRFVGMQRLGFNAFFVHQGIGEELLPAADPSAAMDVPFVHWAKRELLPRAKDMVWTEV